MKLTFFTDPTALLPQGIEDAFGPVAGSEQTQYRLCSKHRAEAAMPASAYAVCDGMLFAQRLDEQHINLILKPLGHQISTLPPVVCYIYRGIKKDSLISGQQIAPAMTNDLTAAIWEAHAALVESVTEATGSAPTTTPGPELFGLGAGDMVDGEAAACALFAEPPENAVFPLVRSGWRVGRFKTSGFAFQVVLESIQAPITLSEVRQADHVISVPALDAAAGEAETVAQLYLKQRVLNYLDPAAFFASVNSAEVGVPGSTGVSVLNAAAFASTVLNRFHNQHAVYVDVRDEHGMVPGLVSDYGAQLRITAGSNTTTVDATRSGWPMLRLAPADFPGLSPSDTEASLAIAFPVGENQIPVVFIGHGATPASFPFPVTGSQRFVELSVVDAFTTPISLRVPAADDAPLCSYLRLTYARGFDWAAYPRQSHDRVLIDNHVIDNLFPAFQMVDELNTPRVRLFHQPRYVDDPHSHDSDLVVAMGAAVDSGHVTFFTFPTLRNIERDDRQTGAPLTDRSASPESFLQETNSRTGQFSFAKRNISLSDDAEQSLLQLEETEDGSRFLAPDWRDFYAMTFTHAEFTALRAALVASTLDQRFPVYLGVTEHSNGLDDAGTYFQSFHLVLRGFTVANDQVAIAEVDTGKTLLIS